MANTPPEEKKERDSFNESMRMKQDMSDLQQNTTNRKPFNVDEHFKLTDELELANDKIAILETKLNREIISNLTLKDEIARLKNYANADVQDKRKTKNT